MQSLGKRKRFTELVSCLRSLQLHLECSSQNQLLTWKACAGCGLVFSAALDTIIWSLAKACHSLFLCIYRACDLPPPSPLTSGISPIAAHCSLAVLLLPPCAIPSAGCELLLVCDGKLHHFQPVPSGPFLCLTHPQQKCFWSDLLIPLAVKKHSEFILACLIYWLLLCISCHCALVQMTATFPATLVPTVLTVSWCPSDWLQCLCSSSFSVSKEIWIWDRRKGVILLLLELCFTIWVVFGLHFLASLSRYCVSFQEGLYHQPCSSVVFAVTTKTVEYPLEWKTSKNKSTEGVTLANISFSKKSGSMSQVSHSDLGRHLFLSLFHVPQKLFPSSLIFHRTF